MSEGLGPIQRAFGWVVLAALLSTPFAIAWISGIPEGSECGEPRVDNDGFVDRTHAHHMVAAGLILVLLLWIVWVGWGKRRWNDGPITCIGVAAIYLVACWFFPTYLLPLALLGALTIVTYGLAIPVAALGVVSIFRRTRQRTDRALHAACWLGLALVLPVGDLYVAFTSGAPWIC